MSVAQYCTPKDLPALLEWAILSLPLCGFVSRRYERLLEDAFADWEDERARGVIDNLHALPPEAIRRVILAPDTFWRLSRTLRDGDEADFTKYLGVSIAVERVRLGHEDPSGTGYWSAMGDFIACNEPAPSPFLAAVPNLVRDGRYTAPALAGRLPIDAVSRFARRPMPNADFRPVKYGDALPFGREEFAVSIAKIERTMTELGSVSEVLSLFVLENTTTIVLRKNAGCDFLSSSSNAFIGQTVLLNPHLGRIDGAVIAESLVHEAIHHVLLRLEVFHPFVSRPADQLPVLRSPWSGRDLGLHSLLGACFVWLGPRHGSDEIVRFVRADRERGGRLSPAAFRKIRYRHICCACNGRYGKPANTTMLGVSTGQFPKAVARQPNGVRVAEEPETSLRAETQKCRRFALDVPLG